MLTSTLFKSQLTEILHLLCVTHLPKDFKTMQMNDQRSDLNQSRKFSLLYKILETPTPDLAQTWASSQTQAWAVSVLIKESSFTGIELSRWLLITKVFKGDSTRSVRNWKELLAKTKKLEEEFAWQRVMWTEWIVLSTTVMTSTPKTTSCSKILTASKWRMPTLAQNLRRKKLIHRTFLWSWLLQLPARKTWF